MRKRPKHTTIIIIIFGKHTHIKFCTWHWHAQRSAMLSLSLRLHHIRPIQHSLRFLSFWCVRCTCGWRWLCVRCSLHTLHRSELVYVFLSYVPTYKYMTTEHSITVPHNGRSEKRKRKKCLRRTTEIEENTRRTNGMRNGKNGLYATMCVCARENKKKQNCTQLVGTESSFRGSSSNGCGNGNLVSRCTTYKGIFRVFYAHAVKCWMRICKFEERTHRRRRKKCWTRRRRRRSNNTFW